MVAHIYLVGEGLGVSVKDEGDVEKVGVAHVLAVRDRHGVTHHLAREHCKCDGAREVARLILLMLGANQSKSKRTAATPKHYLEFVRSGDCDDAVAHVGARDDKVGDLVKERQNRHRGKLADDLRARLVVKLGEEHRPQRAVRSHLHFPSVFPFTSRLHM